MRKIKTIVASTARPLSTQLYIKTGENYTCPWQLKPTGDKNRYSLMKGSRKRFNVVFRDEASSEAATNRLSCRHSAKTKSLNKKLDLKKSLKSICPYA